MVVPPECVYEGKKVPRTDLVQCPYEPSHMFKYTKFPHHMAKCKKNHPNTILFRCAYNHYHLIREDQRLEHLRNCPDAEEFRIKGDVSHLKNIDVEKCFVRQDAEDIEWPDETEADPNIESRLASEDRKEQDPMQKVSGWLEDLEVEETPRVAAPSKQSQCLEDVEETMQNEIMRMVQKPSSRPQTDFGNLASGKQNPGPTKIDPKNNANLTRKDWVNKPNSLRPVVNRESNDNSGNSQRTSSTRRSPHQAARSLALSMCSRSDYVADGESIIGSDMPLNEDESIRGDTPAASSGGRRMNSNGARGSAYRRSFHGLSDASSFKSAIGSTPATRPTSRAHRDDYSDAESIATRSEVANTEDFSVVDEQYSTAMDSEIDSVSMANKNYQRRPHAAENMHRSANRAEDAQNMRRSANVGIQADDAAIIDHSVLSVYHSAHSSVGRGIQADDAGSIDRSVRSVFEFHSAHPSVGRLEKIPHGSAVVKAVDEPLTVCQTSQTIISMLSGRAIVAHPTCPACCCSLMERTPEDMANKQKKRTEGLDKAYAKIQNRGRGQTYKYDD